MDEILSDLEKPLADPYFQFHLLPFNYRYEVQVFCGARGAAHALLTMSRARRGGRFEGKHLRLLSSLAPHIASGVARATARKALESPRNTDTGVVILNESGEIEVANGVAESWLTADSRKNWPLALPIVLSILSRKYAESFPIRNMNIQHPVSGSLYQLHWERQIGSDERYRIVVLMEPLRTLEHPQALLRLGLSQREAEVASSLLRGLAIKEISASLRISQNTVTQHMRSIFIKLGISSRHELAALLMGGAVQQADSNVNSPSDLT